MKRRALLALLALAALLLLAPLALTAIGNYLVVADPLQPASAVVVFGGHVPFRAMEAAALYHQGLTREVWLTQGGYFVEDETLARMGIERTPEHAYSRLVLDRLKVPATAIRLLEGHNINTREEVRTIARELQSRPGDRVILITSKVHTRRVKVIWRSLVGDHPQAIVRYTNDDPFVPTSWYLHTGDAMAVSRELFGLLNAWSGFPIKSERW